MVVSFIRPVRISEATLNTGWLAPDGRLYECSPCDHSKTLDRIMSEVYGVEGTYGNYDDLYNRRFVHITFDCDCSTRNRHGPTQAQVDALWDIAQRATNYEADNILYFLKQWE